MSQYAVRFEWPSVQDAEEHDIRALSADSFESAKMQAAMLWASSGFTQMPSAYRIFQNGATEVYRYPPAALR